MEFSITITRKDVDVFPDAVSDGIAVVWLIASSPFSILNPRSPSPGPMSCSIEPTAPQTLESTDNNSGVAKLAHRRSLPVKTSFALQMGEFFREVRQCSGVETHNDRRMFMDEIGKSGRKLQF
jgi:hypothetical protein